MNKCDGNTPRQLKDFAFCLGVHLPDRGLIMAARHGTKIQTKRNATNRRNWLRRVEHAVRELNRDKFFHYRNRGE